MFSDKINFFLNYTRPIKSLRIFWKKRLSLKIPAITLRIDIVHSDMLVHGKSNYKSKPIQPCTFMENNVVSIDRDYQKPMRTSC